MVGVAPYLDIQVEDEDSLTERFDRKQEAGVIDIAVIRTPRISNFTDFNPFESIPGVSLRYVKHPRDLHSPDMIILPGTKNTMGDLIWMRESGMEAAVLKEASRGKLISQWRRYLPKRRQGQEYRDILESFPECSHRFPAQRLRVMRSIWERVS